MTKGLGVEKIVWSVDLAANEDDLVEHAKQALQFFRKKKSVEIHAIYLFRPDKLDISGHFDLEKLKEQRVKEEKKLETLVKEVGFSDNVTCNVLLDVTPSIGNPYELLTAYASKIEADFILVSSHAFRDISNLLFGSFSENLFRYSQTPVFVVTKKTEEIKKVKKILFPTDFTEESLASFERALLFAKKMDASVVIFCKEGFFKNGATHQSHLEASKVWIKFAKERGVESSYFCSKLYPNDISEAILKTADEMQCDVIAMCTHGYWWNPSGDASIARQVMRKTSKPIWVFHPSETFESGEGRDGHDDCVATSS